MKLELSLQIFEQSSNSEFCGNPSSGERVVSYGRKDGHDEANATFSNFAALLKWGRQRLLCRRDFLYNYGFRRKYTKV